MAALYSSTRHISQTRKTDVIQGGLLPHGGSISHPTLPYTLVMFCLEWTLNIHSGVSRDLVDVDTEGRVILPVVNERLCAVNRDVSNTNRGRSKYHGSRPCVTVKCSDYS